MKLPITSLKSVHVTHRDLEPFCSIRSTATPACQVWSGSPLRAWELQQRVPGGGREEVNWGKGVGPLLLILLLI